MSRPFRNSGPDANGANRSAARSDHAERAEQTADTRSASLNFRTLQDLRASKFGSDFHSATFRSAPHLPRALHGAIDWRKLAKLLGRDEDTARMQVRVALGTLIAVARICPDAVAELAFTASDRAAEHAEAEREALHEIQSGTIDWPEGGTR